MYSKNSVAKVLYIDRNELAFQFQQCIARVLEDIPRVQLYRVSTTSEAIKVLPTIRPDLLVLDDELIQELDALIEALPNISFPVVVQMSDIKTVRKQHENVTYIEKSGSLDGIQSLLSQIAAMASRAAQYPENYLGH